MRGRRLDPKTRALLADSKAWIEELQDESDRGAAALAIAFLEGRLAAALHDALPGTTAAKARVHFGSYAEMVDWAIALDLADDAFRDEFRRLGEIRNKLAHGLHGTTFSTSPIKELCAELRLPDQWGYEKDDPRGRFVIVAVFFARSVQVAAEKRAAASSTSK